MTKVAVHVGEDGNPDGGYATTYGECDPNKGWYEVTMDPLMNLDFVRRYKIVDGCLVLKNSEKTNFETAQEDVDIIKKVVTQQQQVSLDATVAQNAMTQSVAQSQQVNKDVTDLVNAHSQLIVGLQAQITALKKQVDTLKGDSK